MKFSERWLREWIDPSLSAQEIGAQLTMVGLELEAIDPAVNFTGVIVAKVEHVEKHPDADRLSLCTVDTGSEKLAVVCGGKNVREGLKVAFAKVGAELSGNTIKQAKVRGVESFGMLCSEVELCLAEEADGIMELPADAPIGEALENYLELEDNLIELSVTPNRGDCNSIAGVAREVAAINEMPLNTPEILPLSNGHKDELDVAISDDAGCGRYLACVIKNIDATAVSPLWLQEKLRRSGIRSICPVVDVTNYVMIELGQPMHAFDMGKLVGRVQVRNAFEGETLKVLNGDELTLSPEVMVIADEERAHALAGVIGGSESGVTGATKDILLESAFFVPEVIAQCIRKFNIHTDGGYRFERGVDFELPRIAMQRAISLLQSIVGGESGEIHEAVKHDALPVLSGITLSKNRLRADLGFAIPDEFVVNSLKLLNMSVTEHKEGWEVVPPSYRFDIRIEHDLIEEVLRLYGFDKVPETMPRFEANAQANLTTNKMVAPARVLLSHLGYHEVITYSFVSRDQQATLGDVDGAVALENPISQDMAIMRTNLLPGLISVLRNNQHRQQERVRIFEYGLCYQKSGDDITQPIHLAGLISGDRFSPQWDSKGLAIDFFSIKADVESLLSELGIGQCEFKRSTHKALHLGQAASICHGDQVIGEIGMLHPGLITQLDVKGPVAIFELNLSLLPQKPKVVGFTPISKYPAIKRDIAFLVDESISVQSLLDTMKQVSNECVKETQVFDVYQGKGVPQGKKSLAFSMTLQHPERTLIDEEVANIITKVVDSLIGAYQIELRE